MMRIHLSVGQRVTLGFLVMILLVALASGVGVLNSNSARTALDNAHNNSIRIEQIRSLQLRWVSVVTLVDNLLLSRQSSLIIEQLDQEVIDFNGQLSALQNQTIGQTPARIAENKEILKDLQQLGSDLTVIIDQIIEYTQAGSWARAQTLRFTEMTSLQRRLTENLDQLNLNLSLDNDAEVASSNIQQNSARRSLIAIIVFALVMSSILAFFTTRSITIPVAQLLANVKRIMNRDFSPQEVLKREDEFGTLSQATSLMTNLLKETYEQLEQRVADRTKALATSSEVSRRISTILNQKELVAEVVNQVNNAFGYYHTQIYFYDEGSENLIMAGGTGEAGQMMLAQFHKVAKGRGLVGRAAESNQAVLVSDTLHNSEWLPNVLLPDTKSEIALPISIGDQVLGVLDVQHNVTNGLQQEDVDSLQSITNQVAVALQNVRQYENTRKIAADMGVVASVGIAASTITESQKLLQEVVDISKKSFNLYHAHIYLMNDTGDTLELTAGAGEVGRQMVSEKRTIAADSEKSLVARAARTHEGVVVNDVTLAPDFLPNLLLPDTRSEMAVPMIVAGRVIGVLDVQSETANRFTDVDISIQTTLASQVAVALQNARSFSQSQRQAERETAVNLITQKIQGTTSIEAALQMAARELGHALGMKQTLVSLNPEPLVDARKDSQ